MRFPVRHLSSLPAPVFSRRLGRLLPRRRLHRDEEETGEADVCLRKRAVSAWVSYSDKRYVSPRNQCFSLDIAEFEACYFGFVQNTHQFCGPDLDPPGPPDSSHGDRLGIIDLRATRAYIHTQCIYNFFLHAREDWGAADRGGLSLVCVFGESREKRKVTSAEDMKIAMVFSYKLVGER